MRELSIEQMEGVSGGKVNDVAKCAGGVFGMAIICAAAWFMPVAFGSALLTGAGASAIAGATAASAILIDEGC